MNMQCRGLGVALATPFLNDGSLDVAGLGRLCHHVTGGGADFLVALGSTGEAAMLDDAERDEIVAAVRAHAERTPVVVGTGASSTAHAVAQTRRAAALGADGALVVVPPYTRPTQQGLVAHFRAIAEAVPELPIILYNVPSRAATNMLPATVSLLWQLPNIVAIKESSGDLGQIARIAAELPSGKTLLAGDDALALPTIAVGGHGLVSVAGNIVPALMRDLVATARSGAVEQAQAQFAALLPLFEALSLEPNPIPIKTALAILGIAEPVMRLPLLAAGATTRERLQQAIAGLRTEVLHG
ncbi:MAG: 4-hydroxy-tetrahydrodipicolinate synthase [Planctomycetes bacterium]|nr:4-hydroxy-tetrahydrodipicolinate synthase [Planctomycetota bacterium]